MSAASVVAELAEIDALPGAKVEPSVSDGDVDAHTGNDALGMRGHIVRAFEDMTVVRHTIPYKPIVDSLHLFFPSFLFILLHLNNMPFEAEERLIGYLVLK